MTILGVNMKNFDEVEITIKAKVVIQKGKHKAMAKYLASRMESTLSGMNYEDIEVTVYNTETNK